MQQRLLLAATILGSGMAFIDGTVVDVALPALQRAFGAGVAQAQWIVESYALLLGAIVPPACLPRRARWCAMPCGRRWPRAFAG